MPSSLYFLIALAALIAGYFVYGTFVEKVFGAAPEKTTPVHLKADGMDYIEMPPWKIYLIQVLNIAGIGPVFGPILGALYGPAALLWVVIGSIFAGAVHDYFSGMLSVRYGGVSLPEVVGFNLGNIIRWVMRIFSIILLLLVGVVFVASPAALLNNLCAGMTLFKETLPGMGIDPKMFLVGIIFVYYFLATILPVDKIIGSIYPFFAVLLLFMAVSLITMLFMDGYTFYPAAELTNQHPKGLPIVPMLFMTITCGALSGFHATQSPLMARCIANEKYGRPIFYGAMITEGIIGLIWVTLGMSFYQTPAELAGALAHGGPAAVVNNISITLLGGFGAVLAVLGVIILPVTSGDTAFRSARLTIADMCNYDQRPQKNRMLVAIPLFVIGVILNCVDFTTIWNYFSWSNQCLATTVLWTGAAFLYHRGRLHWIGTIPATFMTAASVCFICFEPKLGFGMDYTISMWIGIIAAVACLALFLIKGRAVMPDDPSVKDFPKSFLVTPKQQ